MDDIVKKAMAKWPNVPNCYGWLMLDARGAWRMRDDAAQAAGLPGDKLAHVALLAFINRNYDCDAAGRWYFQNGPQRVYVNLESTPFIAHTVPGGGFVLHTGALLQHIDCAWFSEDGQLLLQEGATLAQVDDRDLAECLPALRLNGAPPDDARLLEWLSDERPAPLGLLHEGRLVPVQRIDAATVPAHFGFVRMPAPDTVA